MVNHVENVSTVLCPEQVGGPAGKDGGAANLFFKLRGGKGDMVVARFSP